MTTLLLVRHGETEWNRAQRMQGRTDIDLSAQGRADVTALGAIVAPWHPRTLIVSPLVRARTSAALLSAVLAGGTSVGGAPAGGVVSGGTSVGGASAGGVVSGGTSVGGTSSGGTSVGGVVSGGVSVGGAVSGETSGGTSGGTSGEVSPGGVSPGGVVSGGTSGGVVSGAVPSGGLEPIVDDAWIEHGLGDWEGATPQAIGPAYERWRAGSLIPPGGESAASIRARVSGAVRAAAAHPGPVLVVTHGGTIRAVLDCFVGLGADRIHPVAPASLTVLDVEGERARLRQFNARP